MPQSRSPHPGHRQSDHRIRLEWGLTGALAVLPGAAYAVVVDVLSFTTAVAVAVEQGTAVLPYRWRDETAAEYAEEHGAVLARGRREARTHGGPSLSPVSLMRWRAGPRLVLPSPNGSTLAQELAGTGTRVVAGSLLNAHAVAAWLAPRLADGGSIALVAAGERWPDGSLRPAVEDLWGAGAVASALAGLGVTGPSPEAALAGHAFERVWERLPGELATCASGRELVDGGFGADVALAAELDRCAVVPVLEGGAFVAG